MRMTDQFLISSEAMFTAPIGEWCEYFHLMIPTVDLGPILKDIYQVKRGVIPNTADHQLFGLNGDASHLRNSVSL
jgi:hypothetical protein